MLEPVSFEPKKGFHASTGRQLAVGTHYGQSVMSAAADVGAASVVAGHVITPIPLLRKR